MRTTPDTPVISSARTSRALPLVAAACASLALTAQAKVLWEGDFETGDLSQWTREQSMGSDRLQIISDPVAQGRYALKVKVRRGDDPIGASGNRAELLQLTLEGEGDDRFYKWSTMWPDDYATSDDWQLFTQFHHEGTDGSPPVELFVRGEDVVLRVTGTDVWTTPLERGAWHDFVLHIKWSSKERDGFVELWYDGQHVLKPVAAQTLYPGERVYMKQGLYRHAGIKSQQTIYHDGMVVADSRDDVIPRAPPPPSDDPVPEAPDEAPPIYTLGEEIRLQQPEDGGCASAGIGLAALVPVVFSLARRGKKRSDP